MLWNCCFVGSVMILTASICFAVRSSQKYKSGQKLTPFHIIFAGVFAAVFTGLLPVFVNMLENESLSLIKTVMFCALHSIQVFTINVEGEWILDHISSFSSVISTIYSAYMSCLFLAAPVLTFGFVISLFQNALAWIRYRMNYWKDVYVFSELNEKSAMLAKDLKEHHDGLIVFTNVNKDGVDEISELLESAKEIRALMFQEELVSVDFMFHSKNSSITFFVISEKENNNLIQSLKILDRYNDRDHTGLYVFSSTVEGELLLSNAKNGKVKVRRVNEVRSLVYRYLYDEGHHLFQHAVEEENTKRIHAAVLGLGKVGTEMVKALAWYGQMDGYTVQIDAFDMDPQAKDKFEALCPELMSEKYNGVLVPNESYYKICIHSGIDVRTKTFADALGTIGKLSFVFVCLGDDELNISGAANVRMLCERLKTKPEIVAVVTNSDEKNALEGITNYRGQKYNIHAIGDLQTTYSEEVLMGSELERLALERHLKWGREEEFWQYEYNYRSSMASAIHMKAKMFCGIAGVNKKEEDLLGVERDALEAIEHKRWNAYMRSEGYIYSGSTDKSSRNDLAKMHHDLVDFESLSEEEKRKDSSICTQ